MGKGMRAGKKPKAQGMGNMQKQMQQMQAMQRKIDALQDEINEMETSASSGGGAVTVVVTGKKEIQIKPEVVDPDDIEMLQDLIMVAANEALRQMEEISSNEMNKLTAGLGIPGL